MRGALPGIEAPAAALAARRIEDIARAWRASAPSAPALRDAARAWSWGELGVAIDAAAAELGALGVGPCDRVLLVAENCAQVPALVFAAASLGAWPAVVNARLSAPELDAVAGHADPRVVLYTEAASPEAASHARRHGAKAAALDGVSRSAPRAPALPGEDHAGEVAALVYTTGTTGTPKGVMLTHAGLLHVARCAVRLRALTPRDRVFGVLPMSHVYGLASMGLGSLMAGAPIHLRARFAPQDLEDALAAEGITVCQGVPAMYTRYLDHLAARGRRHAAPALRAIFCGGSPLSPAVKAEVEDAFGLTLHNGYGLTEASPTITQTRLEAPRSDCSVGPPLPGVEVRIVDAAGRVVEDGAAGELEVRGPTVMKGYFRDAAASSAVLRPGGWLATGDIARQDPDGAMHIDGRLKELIIRSGFNVHPAEVEAALCAHPDVAQCAVVGRDAGGGNEEVVAFVELAPGRQASPRALLDFAAASLAPYNRPSEVVVLRELPAAPSGKILKARLRELARAARTAPPVT